MQGHKDAVYDFVLDKESRTAYSAGADGYVVAWDLDSPEHGRLLLQSGEAFYTIAKIDDYIKVGNREGTIYSIDIIKNALVHEEKMHDGGVFFINEFISGGEDGAIRIQTSAGEDSGRINLATDSLRTCLKWKDRWIVGASDNTIYILDGTSYNVDYKLIGHTNSVFALAMIDDSMLVSAGRDALIKAWDLTIMQEVHSVPAHNYQIKSLAFNGTYLLSSSMDKTIKVWDDKLDLQKVIDFERYQGHTNCINKLEWLDENMFVSCSDDRSLILWKLEVNN